MDCRAKNCAQGNTRFSFQRDIKSHVITPTFERSHFNKHLMIAHSNFRGLRCVCFDFCITVKGFGFWLQDAKLNCVCNSWFGVFLRSWQSFLLWTFLYALCVWYIWFSIWYTFEIVLFSANGTCAVLVISRLLSRIGSHSQQHGFCFYTHICSNRFFLHLYTSCGIIRVALVCCLWQSN